MTDATYKVAVSRYSLSEKIQEGASFWPAFNASFENLELYPYDLVDAIVDGRPFCAWHKSNWRANKNYICGQHLGLDFDTCDQRSTLPALLGDKFISKYGCLVYTTPSHTCEAPRARAVFLVDTPIHQAKNYALAVAALLWVFGAAVDKKCKDPARFFYGSKGCDLEFIKQVLPLELVIRLIAQYQATGLTEKRKHEHRAYDASADQQEVVDALKLIPPWQVDYDEWVQVLMGLHTEFGDGGLQLAESWGDGKDGEVERKWKSFHDNGNTTGTVTIATVFGLAKRFGWQKAA